MGLYVSVYRINPFDKKNYCTNIIDGTDSLALDRNYFDELLEKDTFCEDVDNGIYHFLATGKEIMKLYDCQKEWLKLNEDDVFIVEWTV